MKEWEHINGNIKRVKKITPEPEIKEQPPKKKAVKKDPKE